MTARIPATGGLVELHTVAPGTIVETVTGDLCVMTAAPIRHGQASVLWLGTSNVGTLPAMALVMPRRVATADDERPPPGPRLPAVGPIDVIGTRIMSRGLDADGHHAEALRLWECADEIERLRAIEVNLRESVGILKEQLGEAMRATAGPMSAGVPPLTEDAAAMAAYRGRQDYRGDHSLPWERLSASERDEWQAAARAVAALLLPAPLTEEEARVWSYALGVDPKSGDTWLAESLYRANRGNIPDDVRSQIAAKGGAT